MTLQPAFVSGQPASETQTTQQVDVYFLTLRDQLKGRLQNQYYGGGRDRLRAGTCSVEFSPIWGLKDIAEAAPFYLPEESMDLKAVAEWPVSRFWEAVSAFNTDGNGNGVLYVHGYNIGFEKSCRRAAMFQRALNITGRMVLFSWPADGSFLKYTYDEADLVWSVPHLQKVIGGIVSRMGDQKLDVVAHSMGARGVVQALTALACENPPAPLINELVLLAPDIDTDLFGQYLPLLGKAASRITIYVSENDKALAVSHEVHGYPRLGEAGQHLAVFEDVDTIDISPAGRRRMSGHIYHIFNPAVVNDLKQLLTTGKPAAQRSGLLPAERNGIPYWHMQPADVNGDVDDDEQ